jgi:hypothetical protein
MKPAGNHPFGSPRSMTRQKERYTDDCNDYLRAGSARRNRHLCRSGHAPARTLRDCARAGGGGAQPAARAARRGTLPRPDLVPLPAAAGLFLGLADLLAGISDESAPDLAAFHRPGALYHRLCGGRGARLAWPALARRLRAGSHAPPDRCRGRQCHCEAHGTLASPGDSAGGREHGQRRHRTGRLHLCRGCRGDR